MFNNKNRLSQAIFAAIASSSMAPAVMAQTPQGSEPAIVEEVLVTGIRASLERSMDIKRDSAGVVDAISAEDMGKFPDTNLAESLQRITGVSIDRTNGEGSRITVRGFGPDYNMVTLNGRTMPGGSTYGGSSGADAATRGGNSRAFDFANLASDAVSGVQVYKTGRSSLTTGGIGATVNISTARPLDNPGLHGTIGAKAVNDTTNRTGDDVTPEVSGMISWTDDTNRFGVSLSASHQQRDSGYTGATVNEWQIGHWGQDDLYNQDGAYETATNQEGDLVFGGHVPTDGQLYARPNDIRYAFSDTTRTRDNAQLTLQFSPDDRFVATVDYTYAKNDIEEHRGEIGNWIQNGSNIAEVVFDDSTIATPVLVREDYTDASGAGRADIGYEQQYRSQENTLESIGFNLEYMVNDALTLTFDAHDTSMESLPTGPGLSGELAVGLGAPVKQGKTLFFGGDLPAWTYDVDGGEVNPEDVSSTTLRVFSAAQVSDARQYKLDGVYEFDNGRFDFGIDRNELSSATTSYNGNNNQMFGGWGAVNQGEFPDGMIEHFDVAGEFSDFNTGVSPNDGFRADARELADFLVNESDLYTARQPYIGVESVGPVLDDDNNPITDDDGELVLTMRNSRGYDLIEEDTTAAYVELTLDGEFAGFETRVMAGLRYENTKATSTTDTPEVTHMEWQSDNDFAAVSALDAELLFDRSSYDNLLPSFSLDVSITDQLTGRFAFSKTIARPGLGDLSYATTGFALDGSTLNSAVPRATGPNPQLRPLESMNYDLSLEWYFDDTSYVSVGWWEKRVSNFVGQSQVDQNHFGIRDQTAGPRAQAARALLEEGGYSLDDGNMFTMMVMMERDLEDDFDGSSEQASAYGEDCASCVITPNDDDPLMEFQTSVPVNNREAQLYGMEFAVQHFFSDTGFGVLANYTLVNGDVKFDDLASPSEDQFALLGLSDTANLVLMYENHNVEARLAYNWRAEYLSRTNVGAARNPGYVESYSQLDLNVSYAVTDNISVSFEGLNLTGENRREHARNNIMLLGLEELGARYQIGARYTF